MNFQFSIFNFQSRSHEGQAPLEVRSTLLRYCIIARTRPAAFITERATVSKRLLTGQAAILSVLFVMAAMLAVTFGTAAIGIKETRVAEENARSRRAFFTAEAGVEDIVYRLQRGKNVSIGSPSPLALNDGEATISINTVSPTMLEIISRGDVSRAVRAARAMIVLGSGANFAYAMQAGSDGIEMGNTASIQGNVYSNGTIQGANNSVITGDAFIAGAGIVLGRSYELGDPNVYTAYDVGKSSPVIDIAQSFTPTVTGAISQISLYIKKVGSPPNRTVRIVPTAANGNPATSGIGSGTLYANQITTNYGWINVPLSSTPTLQVNVRYWIVLDNSANISNYYVLGLDAANGNIQDVSKYSTAWTSGPWSNVPGDLAYRAYMGSAVNELRSMIVHGDAYANTIINSEICGDAHYQTIDNPSTDFLNNPISPCQAPRTPGAAYPNSGDQPVQPFPISNAQIETWKQEAEAGGVYNGPCPYRITNGMVIGPMRINCDVTTDGNMAVTVKTPIWVNGNIGFGNGVTVLLDQSYGGRSGVIITDFPTAPTTKGRMTTGNSFVGCGSGGYSGGQCTTYCDDNGCSYLLLLSTYSGSQSALGVANGAIGAIFYAPYGKFGVGNNVEVNSVTAKNISLANGASIRYETGLTNAVFSQPRGVANWNINSWQEVLPP